MARAPEATCGSWLPYHTAVWVVLNTDPSAGAAPRPRAQLAGAGIWGRVAVFLFVCLLPAAFPLGPHDFNLSLCPWRSHILLPDGQTSVLTAQSFLNICESSQTVCLWMRMYSCVTSHREGWCCHRCPQCGCLGDLASCAFGVDVTSE